MGTLHRHCFDTDGNQWQIADVELERMPPLDLVIREADELARWLHEYRTRQVR